MHLVWWATVPSTCPYHSPTVRTLLALSCYSSLLFTFIPPHPAHLLVTSLSLLSLVLCCRQEKTCLHENLASNYGQSLVVSLGHGLQNPSWEPLSWTIVPRLSCSSCCHTYKWCDSLTTYSHSNVYKLFFIFENSVKNGMLKVDSMQLFVARVTDWCYVKSTTCR